jgi:hypothetical protein
VASRLKAEEHIGNVWTCGIDPGKPPKTVFATNMYGDGTWGKWLRTRQPPAGLFSLAIAEKPTGVIRNNRTPASVVSPAGWGMAALFSVQLAPDGMRVWIPVEDWKRKLLGSAWNMKKENACRNFVEMFKLVGLDPDNDSDQDEIDAVAIAEAGQRFTRKELKKWQVKW